MSALLIGHAEITAIFGPASLTANVVTVKVAIGGPFYLIVAPPLPVESVRR